MTHFPGSWEDRSTLDWAERLGAATAEFHARIGSTSDRARELLEEGRPLPAFVLADRQLAGRGRQDRKWVSDTPRGLWFTVARPGSGDAAATLPLRVGLAVARALDAAASDPHAAASAPNAAAPRIRTDVKWPNDIMLGDLKLGGILCERMRGALLVGIGINLNQPVEELPRGLVTPATSLLLQTGRPVSRARVLERLADELAAVWSAPAPEIPADELHALNARSALRGRRLSVSGVVRHSSRPPRKVEALPATGGPIHAEGALEIRDDTGARLRVIAGSVEFRS